MIWPFRRRQWAIEVWSFDRPRLLPGRYPTREAALERMKEMAPHYRILQFEARKVR